jgi:hypothetical protein
VRQPEPGALCRGPGVIAPAAVGGIALVALCYSGGGTTSTTGRQLGRPPSRLWATSRRQRFRARWKWRSLVLDRAINLCVRQRALPWSRPWRGSRWRKVWPADPTENLGAHHACPNEDYSDCPSSRVYGGVCGDGASTKFRARSSSDGEQLGLGHDRAC